MSFYIYICEDWKDAEGKWINSWGYFWHECLQESYTSLIMNMDPRVTVVMTLQTSSTNMQALNAITACKLYMNFFKKCEGLLQVARSWLWLAFLFWFWYVNIRLIPWLMNLFLWFMQVPRQGKAVLLFQTLPLSWRTWKGENLTRFVLHCSCLLHFLMFLDLTCFGWLLQASEAELEAFFAECNFYSLVSHLYWGIWAIVQVNSITIFFGTTAIVVLFTCFMN